MDKINSKSNVILKLSIQKVNDYIILIKNNNVIKILTNIVEEKCTVDLDHTKRKIALIL